MARQRRRARSEDIDRDRFLEGSIDQVLAYLQEVRDRAAAEGLTVEIDSWPGTEEGGDDTLEFEFHEEEEE